VRVSRGELSDLLLSVGGLLLATGAVVLLIRKSGDPSWTDFERFAIVAAPAALLYVLALAGGSSFAQRAEPWQTVLAVTAILLWPVALLEFLRWVGADIGKLLYVAAVFAATGVLALYAARRTRVAYAVLLAGVSGLTAWMLVWGKILDHPSADTFRWLLLAGGALLLLLAFGASLAGAVEAAEVAIAGAIGLVGAGVYGVLAASLVSAFSEGGERPFEDARSDIHPLQGAGWDIYLLIASLALIWAASRARIRGLAYVGAAGVLAFLLSVGEQVSRQEAGHGASHDLAGWPLVLIILGAAALVVSLPAWRR
jgi:hypothetical protein